MKKTYKNTFKFLFNIQLLQKVLSVIKFRLIRYIQEKVLFRFSSKESVFTSIWRNNYWGNNESFSGPGSTLEYTKLIRKEMPIMFNNFGIKSVFDAPCGDLHWMQHVLKDAKFSYLGGDIVSDLVSLNKNKFETSRVNFIKFDITIDSFPVADVWLCRAVFYHLSYRDIYLALEQFIASNIKYILTTNHITGNEHVNEDITTGGWRLLNLKLPPFSFPGESLWEVDDYLAPDPATTLTLWDKAQIEKIMPKLRKICQ